MARPRTNKSPRKGQGTSFGKQSDAEKAFYKRPKKVRYEDPKRSRRDDSDSRPDSRREDSDKAPFKRREAGGESFRSSPPRFTRSSRPGDDKKPFNKRSDDSFSKRSDGPPRFTKSSRPGSDTGEFKRPFSKRTDDSTGRRSDGPPRFSKPSRPGSESGSYKKPFRKSGEDSYRSKPDGPPRFSKSPRKEGDETARPKKPFEKREDSFRAPSFSRSRAKDNFSGGRKDEPKSFVQSRVVKSGDFTKTVRKEAEPKQADGLTRLNKYVANAGVGSRRQADELIKMGLISVNGTTITELGTKVKVGDIIRYEDRVLKAEKPVYVLLNKPKGFITTTDDPQERSTVMALVAGACKERIYPVGRLDRNTTGLLLLTNDGDLADKLTHPSYKTKKVYKAELDKPLTKNDLQKIVDGVHLEEGRAMVDDIAIISEDKKTVGLEIHIGWNRVVRRIFESLGYEIIKLDRSVFAGLDKKDIARGQWRFLKSEEVVRLKHFK